MRRVAAEATFDEEVVGTVEPLELKISSQNPVWKICTQLTEVKKRPHFYLDNLNFSLLRKQNVRVSLEMRL